MDKFEVRRSLNLKTKPKIVLLDWSLAEERSSSWNFSFVSLLICNRCNKSQDYVREGIPNYFVLSNVLRRGIMENCEWTALSGACMHISEKKSSGKNEIYLFWCNMEQVDLEYVVLETLGRKKRLDCTIYDMLLSPREPKERKFRHRYNFPAGLLVNWFMNFQTYFFGNVKYFC